MAEQVIDRPLEKRLNYFKGQFLQEQDFRDEQAYHIDRHRRHLHGLHTPGIIEGLGVTVMPDKQSIQVDSGTALDPQGHLIVLTEPISATPKAEQRGKSLLVVIAYAELATDLATVGESKATRTHERHEVTFLEQADLSSISLGRITVDAQGNVTKQEDRTLRTAAGAKVGDKIKVRELTITNATNQSVKLSVSEPSKLSINGNLYVEESLTVGGAAVFQAGKVGIGTSTPETPLHVVGKALITGDLNFGRPTRQMINLWQEPDGRIPYAIGIQNWTQYFRTGGNFAWYSGGGHSDEELNAGGGTLRMVIEREAGNVGIGTPSPRAKLEVAGAIMPAIGDDGNAGIIFPKNSSDITGGAWIQYTDGPEFWLDINNTSSQPIPVPGTSAPLPPRVGNIKLNASGDIHLLGRSLFASGDVTLGTQNRQSTLTVSGTISTNTIVAQQLRLSTLEIAQRDKNYNQTVIAGGTELGILVNRLIIPSNVIIGGSDPQQAKLHVVGDAHVTGSLSVAKLQVVGGAIMPEIGGNDNAGILFPKVLSDVSGGVWIRHYEGNDSLDLEVVNTAKHTKIVRLVPSRPQDTVAIDPGVQQISGPPPTQVHTRSGNINLTASGNIILTPNNVGIGTASPQAKLHVVGDLLVTGTVTAANLPRSVNSLDPGQPFASPASVKLPSTDSRYATEQFVNNLTETLEPGDVLIISASQASLYRTNNIPIPEVDWAQSANNRRVCGIVCEVQGELVTVAEDPATLPVNTKKHKRSNAAKANPPSVSLQPRAFTPAELDQLDRSKVAPGQIGWMVTLGAYAHCKVDADIAPIAVGDLLTTSPTKGHAQKVLDPSQAIGAILGKALGALQSGKGKIPVLVTLH